MTRSDEGDRIEMRVLFSGMVQGVGFRFTTVRLAANHDVTGTVRNLPDGRVEVIAEGRRGEVERFIEAIRRRMGRYIRGEERKTFPATGSYTGFDVSF